MQLHIARGFGLGAAEFELVDHRRRGGDEVEVELAREAFLDDFQMEQAKETAAETEAERCAALGLEAETGVVEARSQQKLSK